MERLNLSMCSFSKERKALSIASEVFAGSFPREIEVVSHHTGSVVLFRAVGPEHPEWDEDGWDGEQCVYAPVDPQRNCNTLTVYHEW